MNLVMFIFCFNCFREALIQPYGHFAGWSWTVLCYIDRCFYYFVHPIHIRLININTSLYNAVQFSINETLTGYWIGLVALNISIIEMAVKSSVVPHFPTRGRPRLIEAAPGVPCSQKPHQPSPPSPRAGAHVWACLAPHPLIWLILLILEVFLPAREAGHQTGHFLARSDQAMRHGYGLHCANKISWS